MSDPLICFHNWVIEPPVTVTRCAKCEVLLFDYIGFKCLLLKVDPDQAKKSAYIDERKAPNA